MNVAQIIQRAARLANRVDDNATARLLQFVNEGRRTWARKYPWPQLKREINIVCDGTKDIYFPQHVNAVLWLGDPTNKRPLQASEHWDRTQPEAYFGGTTGNAFLWRKKGWSCVFAQPTAPAALTFEPQTTDSQTVYVSGYATDTTASGSPGAVYPISESLSLTSTSVATSTLVYSEIRSLGKDTLSSGDVIVKAGGSQVSRLVGQDWDASYLRGELLYVPSAGTILRAGVLDKPFTISSVTQHPEPGVDPQYLVWYAAGALHKAFGEGAMAEQCFAHAQGILEDQAYEESTAGDQDYRGLPDDEYWNNEENYYGI